MGVKIRDTGVKLYGSVVPILASQACIAGLVELQNDHKESSHDSSLNLTSSRDQGSVQESAVESCPLGDKRQDNPLVILTRV